MRREGDRDSALHFGAVAQELDDRPLGVLVG